MRALNGPKPACVRTPGAPISALPLVASGRLSKIDHDTHIYSRINSTRLQAVYPTLPLLVLLKTDDSLLELPRRDTSLEHDVNLSVRSALHLRKAEVRSDEGSKRCSTPNVAALSTD